MNSFPGSARRGCRCRWPSGQWHGHRTPAQQSRHTDPATRTSRREALAKGRQLHEGDGLCEVHRRVLNPIISHHLAQGSAAVDASRLGTAPMPHPPSGLLVQPREVGLVNGRQVQQALADCRIDVFSLDECPVMRCPRANFIYCHGRTSQSRRDHLLRFNRCHSARRSIGEGSLCASDRCLIRRRAVFSPSVSWSTARRRNRQRHVVRCPLQPAAPAWRPLCWVA